MVGPLLSNQTLHSQYLGYVKDILDNILTDAFFTEISEHILAMRSYIITDPFAFGVDVDGEASTTPADANCGDTGTCPFLPALKLRREEIYKQLTALGDGTFPRATEDLFDPAESCVDWNSAEIGKIQNACGICTEAEPCYSSLGCAFRNTEDGTWGGWMSDCNEANGYCDACFPDSPCPVTGGGGGEIDTPSTEDDTIVISEVSSNPVEGTCGGQDYVELFNPTGFKIYLKDYVLHDDKGPKDPSAFKFPELAIIEGNSVLLLCANGNGVSSPSFGIKDNDAISLHDTKYDKPVTSVGRMRGMRGEGQSWTLQSDGTYAYKMATPFVFGDYESPPENDGFFALVGSAASENACAGGLAVWLSLILAITFAF